MEERDRRQGWREEGDGEGAVPTQASTHPTGTSDGIVLWKPSPVARHGKRPLYPPSSL